MRTEELLIKLSNKYPSPGYAFVSQVRNGTGYARGETRTADAMAMSLWPSRGVYLEGFELKVSRSDWLHELKSPEKAEEMVKYCDYWYLVVSDESIVKLEELPKTWGLMAASGRGGSIKIIKEAPKLTPVHCDRLLLASIFRNVTERMVARDLIQPKIDDARKLGENNAMSKHSSLVRELENLEEKIKVFENASGVMIKNEWKSMRDIGSAVKEVLEGRDKHAERRLKNIHKAALDIAKYVEGTINQYEIENNI